MNAKAAPVLLVLVSVILSVGLSSLLEANRPDDGRAATAVALEAPGYEALEQRLAELERRVEELGTPLVAYEAPAETPTAPAQRVDLSADSELQRALDGRLAALERRLARAELPEGEDPLARLRREEEERLRRQDTIRDAKAILADPNAPVAEKLIAHEVLRRVADAYTPSMVEGLVQMGTNDPDPEVRARVWCSFNGSSHLPELVPHLLRALTTDPDPRVRDESSETLGNYLDDPDVLAAVKYAAEFDVSPRVRKKAARTLGEAGALVTER